MPRSSTRSISSARGSTNAAPTVTAQQALALFLTREVAARNYTTATRRTYSHDLNDFLHSLPENTTSDQLTLTQVKQYLAWLDE